MMRDPPHPARRRLVAPLDRPGVAELPGLVLAIDAVRGPVTELVLAAEGWDSHPRRLGVNGRVLRLSYFASQPTSLLTALCADGDQVDLLLVARTPPAAPRTRRWPWPPPPATWSTPSTSCPPSACLPTAPPRVPPKPCGTPKPCDAEGGQPGPTPRRPAARGMHQPAPAR